MKDRQIYNPYLEEWCYVSAMSTEALLCAIEEIKHGDYTQISEVTREMLLDRLEVELIARNLGM